MNKIIWISAAVLSVAACAKNEVVPVNSGENQEITFNVAPKTKATTKFADNLKFKSYAYYLQNLTNSVWRKRMTDILSLMPNHNKRKDRFDISLYRKSVNEYKQKMKWHRIIDRLKYVRHFLYFRYVRYFVWWHFFFQKNYKGLIAACITFCSMWIHSCFPWFWPKCY